MSTATEARTFEFGGFRLDVAQRQLVTSDGGPIELPSRAFDLLLYLVERPGELLDKSTLLKGVWPKTVVEESNLSQCIFALRRALGDTAQEHRFIVTVPGRGYQFVAPVRQYEAVAAAPAAGLSVRRVPHGLKTRVGAISTIIAALALGAYLLGTRTKLPEAVAPISNPFSAPANTIAVLPFEDVSPNHDMEYLADGIAEELTTRLASVHDLRVIGRRSSFAFKGKDDDLRTIGEKLKVDNILEGTVGRQGDRIRISAQLSRVRDGVSLWTESYDRKLDDVLDVEGSIAREVVAALGQVVQQGNHSSTSGLNSNLTKNAGAYNAYLRGNYFFARQTAEDVARARDEFLRAVELDPQFAMAHAWLARTYEHLTRFGVGDVAKNKSFAFASLERALKLEPTISDIWWVQSRFAEGQSTPLSLRASSLERALTVNPGDADVMVRLGDIYFRQGRRVEGLDMVRRAYQVDPLWPQAVWWVAFAGYTFNGDRELTLKMISEMEVLAPTDPRAPILRGWVAMNEGRPLDWDSSMERAIIVAPRDVTTHRYVATDYGDLGAIDAALYHARAARLIAPDNAGGWYVAAHVLLISGDIAGARQFVQQALAINGSDYQAQLAQSELQYYTGDCPGAIQSMLLARPALGQPEAALDLLPDIDRSTTLVWCLRKLGNVARASEIARVFNRELSPPLVHGLYDGTYARLAAAMGDRTALIAHLSALAKTKASQLEFSRYEPMIQPYLHDPEVKALLDTLDARRAEWRRILPASSTRVPIPGIDAAK